MKTGPLMQVVLRKAVSLYTFTQCSKLTVFLLRRIRVILLELPIKWVLAPFLLWHKRLAQSPRIRRHAFPVGGGNLLCHPCLGYSVLRLVLCRFLHGMAVPNAGVGSRIGGLPCAVLVRLPFRFCGVR
jgi:hypothetical protein